jgi:SNF5 / SMARCB1 / INI1
MHKIEALASMKEVLVPIRVEFEVEGLKITDTFTWNMNGTST